jgi:hypothetical protein
MEQQREFSRIKVHAAVVLRKPVCSLGPIRSAFRGKPELPIDLFGSAARQVAGPPEPATPLRRVLEIVKGVAIKAERHLL